MLLYSQLRLSVRLGACSLRCQPLSMRRPAATAAVEATIKLPAAKGRWTDQEDELLRRGMAEHGRKWTIISRTLLPHRTIKQCLQRWSKVLQPSTKIGPWEKKEDIKLKRLVRSIGEGKWSAIAAKMNNGRNAASCHQRWSSHLDPSLNKGAWLPSEDSTLLAQYAVHPQQWSVLRDHLPGRCDLDIRKRHMQLTRKRSNRLDWSAAEDEALTSAVLRLSTRAWAKVAAHVPGRSSAQCSLRWTVLAMRMNTTELWSREQDELLKQGVEELGEAWAEIAARIGGKTASECRMQWGREMCRKIDEVVLEEHLKELKKQGR